MAFYAHARRRWRSLSPSARASARIAAMVAAALLLAGAARSGGERAAFRGDRIVAGDNAGVPPALRAQAPAPAAAASAPDPRPLPPLPPLAADEDAAAAASEVGLVHPAVPGDPDAVTGDERGDDERAAPAPPRVFVYPLPPRFNADLLARGGLLGAGGAPGYEPHAWETVLHRALLASPTRAAHPREADLFFLPVYAAAALWAHADPEAAAARNGARSLVRDAIAWAAARYGPYLAARRGADHVVPLAYGLGDCLEPLDDQRPIESGDEAAAHAALRAALGGATVLTSGPAPAHTAALGAHHALAEAAEAAVRGEEEEEEEEEGGERRGGGGTRDAAAPPAAAGAAAAARPPPLGAGLCFDPARHIVVPAMPSAAALRLAGAEDAVPLPDGAAADAPGGRDWAAWLRQLAASLAAARREERRGARPLLLTFRGATTLQRQGDPWRTARAMGHWGPDASAASDSAATAPATAPAAAAGVPLDLTPRTAPCYDDVARSADPEACAQTCSWELARRRPFSGGLRPLLRRTYGFLPREWGVRVNDPPGKQPALEMAGSRYCLAARGDHRWARRLIDALLTGCVPVALADATPLPLEASQGAGVRWGSAAVRARERHFDRVPYALRRWSADKRRRAQAAGAALLPRLLWVPAADAGAAAEALALAAARARAADGGGAAVRFLHAPSLLRLLPRPPRRRRRAALDVTVVNPRPRPADAAADADADADDDDGSSSGGSRRPVLCLMTQMTVDRAPLLRRTMARWGGVASVAVLSTDPEADARGIADALGEAAAQVRVALVRDERWPHFPVNSLRNAALEGCPPDGHVVVVDVDFLLSRGAYARLQRHAAADRAGRNAFLIPAFELEDSVVEAGRLDLDKADVVAMARGDGAHPRVRRADARPFHVRNFPYGHHMTDFERWFAADAPYTVAYEYGAEPYVMARPPLPWFDESFVAYGQNKVQWLHELAAAGFRYTVLPDVFLVHAHVESAARGTKREKDYKIGWSCWRDFLDRIEAEYGYAPPDPCWAGILLKQALHKYGAQCVTNAYARTKPYDPPLFGGEK